MKWQATGLRRRPPSQMPCSCGGATGVPAAADCTCGMLSAVLPLPLPLPLLLLLLLVAHGSAQATAMCNVRLAMLP